MYRTGSEQHITILVGVIMLFRVGYMYTICLGHTPERCTYYTPPGTMYPICVYVDYLREYIVSLVYYVTVVNK